MKLIIVESPNKCKKIESYLGAGWTVKASVGHVRDLPEHEFGVDLESFRPTYVLTDSGKKVIGSLKKVVTQAEEVYIATDPDREGEAIGWHVKTALGIKEYKRVVFHEITKGGVLKSLRAPRKLDMNLVRAQEARRILDRMVGYSVSPCLSKAYQRPMSAGRVQSPAVYLVVERELAIRQFKPEPYLEVYLHFLDEGMPWKAKWNWEQRFERDKTDMPALWTDRVSADNAAAIQSLAVKSIESREVSRRPPPPFITSTLIQAVSVVLKMDSAEAMQAAQKLFEHGLITYHRTDNSNLSEEGIGMMRSWMIDNGLAGYIADPPNQWKAKDEAQEAHEAIRPTDPSVEQVELDDPRLNQVYELIWKRSMACQMKSARYCQTRMQLIDQDEKHLFSAQGRSLLFAGWLKLAAKDFTNEEEGEDSEVQLLPKLEEGQVLKPVRGEVLEKQTRPPGRYTEASLVKKMESEGIGRPATYAAIMKNIKQRGYVEVKLRKFWASELGISLIHTLKSRFAFVELDYTRSVENDLDALASGKADYAAVMRRVYESLKVELESIASIQVQGFESGFDKGKSSKQSRGSRTKKESGDRKSHSRQSRSPSRAHVDAMAGDELFVCPKCGTGHLVKRSGSNGTFWGCSRYPQCKETRPDAAGKPAEYKVKSVSNERTSQDIGAGKPCPQKGCSGKQVIRIGSSKGRYPGVSFMGCSRYPECTFYHRVRSD